MKHDPKIARKATTFRLEPKVQERLAAIGKVLKVPINRLVNEAVDAFVQKRTAGIVLDMEEVLKTLKSRFVEDPEFECAIVDFAASEARHGKTDPAEGKVEEKRGPVQARVHELLNG
jgi:predicted DNA-binding protein